jgi:hypothetical protein
MTNLTRPAAAHKLEVGLRARSMITESLWKSIQRRKTVRFGRINGRMTLFLGENLLTLATRTV